MGGLRCRDGSLSCRAEAGFVKGGRDRGICAVGGPRKNTSTTTARIPRRARRNTKNGMGIVSTVAFHALHGLSPSFALFAPFVVFRPLSFPKPRRSWSSGVLSPFSTCARPLPIPVRAMRLHFVREHGTLQRNPGVKPDSRRRDEPKTACPGVPSGGQDLFRASPTVGHRVTCEQRKWLSFSSFPTGAVDGRECASYGIEIGSAVRPRDHEVRVL